MQHHQLQILEINLYLLNGIFEMELQENMIEHQGLKKFHMQQMEHIPFR
jgi:hypothetical protein